MASNPAIEHVVLIIKENHGFDNYFGTLAGANGFSMPRSPNPPTHDPDHRHEAWLTRQTTAVKLQFVEQDIPAYFAYARRFTLCDNYFTDVAGPSTPNHLMLIAGDSPIIDNPPGYRLAPGAGPWNLPSLPSQLEQVNLTWRNYGGYAFDFITGLKGRNKRLSAQFAADASVGNLAAIFVTWDDWGGWFDHVNPLEVETWKPDGSQFRYGSRVGCLAISPDAKTGHVSHELNSHVSLLKFCETLFGLPALNARVGNAQGMADCFDWTRTPAAPPGTILV